MKVSEFRALLEELNETSSWKRREAIVRNALDTADPFRPVASLLAGQEFDNNGIAPKTAITAVQNAFPDIDTDKSLSELRKSHGTVTDALLAIESELPAPAEPDANLTALYSCLQRVASKSGDAATQLLAQTFRRFDPVVVSYGVLDDYTIGVQSKTVKNAVARPDFETDELARVRGLVPDAVEFVSLWNSESLPDSPRPGTPFQPMAAKSKQVPETDDWVGQYKLDGYRLLIHVTGDSVRAFTRNVNDESQSLPELDQVDWPDGEFIFDCEAVAYTGETQLGFTETSERIGRKHNILTDSKQIHFKLFDLLYANGDVSREPFADRFELLQSVAPDHKFVEVIPVFQDVSACLDAAEEHGYEGIIAKDKTAPYQFGKRSNYWRKVKLTEETVDVRVCGFIQEYSSKTGETLGALEVETKDGVSVGRVGTGFSEEQAKEIWNNQDDYYGAVVEVQFEGFDDNLRFPSFQNFRDNGEPDSLSRIQSIADR